MLNTALQPFLQQYRTAVSTSYRESFINRQAAGMETRIQAREYYDGVQTSQLTDRTRQFLQAKHDANFTVNYCKMVVNAKTDRLKVTGFNTDDTDDSTLQDTIWKWWRKNRMDRKQGIVHHAAVLDGDAYVLVEWDETAQMPRFHFEPAYTGDGVMVYYSEERRDEIEFASKQWRINYGSQAGKTRRLNLYFPNRIEKYVSNDDVADGNWRPYIEDIDVIGIGHLGQAGIVWFTDTRTQDGTPLGIPIIHFKHNDTGDSYGVSHLADVIPIQDAVNKAMIDLLAAMDANGFPLLVGFGADWSGVKVGPGSIAHVPAKPSEASLDSLAAMSPDGLLRTYDALVREVARVSGTPLSYIQSSGQVAAEGTMKQQEIALVSQVLKAQTDFGNGWEDVMNMARRLHNAFSDDPELDTDSLIETTWDAAESRNDKEEAETLAIKVEKLGVSEAQAQAELGYDASEIAAFQRDKRRNQALTIRQTVQQGQAQNDDTETLTQTENEADDNTGTQAA